MSHWWVRKVDVLNRGFSGYNSKWGLLYFPEIVLREKPDLVFVFFGANDAVDPQVLQHVPLAEYSRNIDSIVTTLLQVS